MKNLLKELKNAVPVFVAMVTLSIYIFFELVTIMGYGSVVDNGLAMGASTFITVMTAAAIISAFMSVEASSKEKTKTFFYIVLLASILVGVFSPVWMPIIYVGTVFSGLMMVGVVCAYLFGDFKPKDETATEPETTTVT